MDERHDPSQERERQMKRMNRQMEERQRDVERRIGEMHRRVDPRRGSGHPELGPVAPDPKSGIRIDLLEREDEFVLTAAVPEFAGDEIDVNLVDDVVRIETTREEGEEEEEGRYVVRELGQSMSRSVELGSPIDEEEEISARYENGVVTVRLPKAEPTGDESVRHVDIE